MTDELIETKFAVLDAPNSYMWAQVSIIDTDDMMCPIKYKDVELKTITQLKIMEIGLFFP